MSETKKVFQYNGKGIFVKSFRVPADSLGLPKNTVEKAPPNIPEGSVAVWSGVSQPFVRVTRLPSP